MERGIIKPITISNSTSLKENFRKYFLPELDWIQNSFIEQNQDIEHLPLNSQEELAELSSESKLRLEFAQNKLSTL